MSCQSRRKLVNQRISGLPVCPYLWNYGQRGFKAFHQLGKNHHYPCGHAAAGKRKRRSQQKYGENRQTSRSAAYIL